MMQLVLTTFSDAEQARGAVRHLVNMRLAACGTIVPMATSIYIWKDVVEENSECLVLLKTTVHEALRAELLKIHPYEVPEILSITIDSSHPAYTKWVMAQCSS